MAKKQLNPMSAEEATIRAVLKKHKLPPSVKGFELEFGEDSTGDLAVWILFDVDQDLQPSKEKLSALTRLDRSVRADLLATGITRWPYVKFRVTA
jgi:hypothetical protein